MNSIFDQDLPPTPANHAPMTPLLFLERTAEVYPQHPAIIHGPLTRTWAETYERCRRLASALKARGIGRNDTVAVMLPNTPPMVEAHFFVPMAGAVLNTLNTRLDAATIAFMLDHGEAKVLIVDPEFAALIEEAVSLRKSREALLVIDAEDSLFSGTSKRVGELVMDPLTMSPVPADGQTIGEVMFRGNITMKGYLKNPAATQEAFAGGWFHTGDLAVQYPDGYIKIKDRSKDVIISGGENISSIEVEDVLYRHPDVLAAAVVAKPDKKWGETPCAFVELKVGARSTPADIVAHCREHLAAFKVPRTVIFGELPKTSTGKIQKFELRTRAGSVAAITASESEA
jgi:acyl-CoA synthetase (AMP-forming)/AMP-acid ligase II